MRIGDEAIHGEGRVTEHQLYDHTALGGYDPFKLPPNMPMMNPVAWELRGDWEDGWHLFGGKVVKVEGGEIIKAYKLEELSKENGDIL